jgi:predicted KAP-like P-loop ATPase
MEPISAIALSLALGAGAEAGKAVVSEVVKNAYASLKNLIKTRYPKVSVEQLEQAPDSKNRRAVVEEDLTASGAAQDTELAAAAHTLIKLIEQQAPAAAAAIGVDLKDVSAANLRLADIAASGTGVKVEHGTFTGDIDIRGVRAGVPPSEPKGT